MAGWSIILNSRTPKLNNLVIDYFLMLVDRLIFLPVVDKTTSTAVMITCVVSAFDSVVNTVLFHTEGQCLASASADKSMKMWDIRSHLLIQHYPAHDDEVTSISMHPVSFHLKF